jgi:3-methyladenine DNA glycosylase/8-oxoguanine DNA glycosylase
MLRSIREELAVTEALNKGSNVYPRAWDAFEGLCWILAHQEIVGASIQTIGQVYHMHKQAAGGYGVPSLTVIYTIDPQVVTLHRLKVG